MIETKHELITVWKDDNVENDHPFIFAIKDRMIKSEDRWVTVALDEKDAALIYDYLHKYFS